MPLLKNNRSSYFRNLPRSKKGDRNSTQSTMGHFPKNQRLFLFLGKSAKIENNEKPQLFRKSKPYTKS